MRRARPADASAKPATNLVGDRLFVLDERQVPDEIERLALDTTAEAMDRTRHSAEQAGSTDTPNEARTDGRAQSDA
ncbi:hypothetical protein ABZ686_21930 [Streptomyces sp. NPDC006992]|uniref:hypothetical protein n=1 Tax=Streptomyces sp. NPDC006992 TaxID=3155601 RepID=UPI0033F35BD7